jgi:hypothetical protein
MHRRKAVTQGSLDSYQEVRTTQLLYQDETVDDLLTIHINDTRHTHTTQRTQNHVTL